MAIAAGYVVVSFVTGAVFAERLAEWQHIPACNVKLAASSADSDFAALSEAERKRRLLQGLLRSMPQLRELPMVREIAPLLTGPKRTRRTTDFTSHCACLADAAVAETRWDFMVWVATLRVHTPSGVSRFSGVMANLDKTGRCGNARSAS